MTSQELFDTTEKTHVCPRCPTGFIVGPQWEITAQGKVYVLYCVICGWLLNSPKYCIDYNEPEAIWKAIEVRVKRATRPVRIITVRKRDLSRFIFEDVKKRI